MRSLGTGLAAVALVICLTGCGADEPPPEAAPSADASHQADSGPVVQPTVRYLYDPLATWTTFPDDFYSVDDDASATGRRVDFAPTRAPWREGAPNAHRAIMDALDGFDGWGLNAGIALHFDGPLAPLPTGEPGLDSEVLQLLAMGPEGPKRVPVEVVVTEDHGVILWPMRPLAQATLHGLILTKAALAEDGGSVDPGPVLASLLHGTATDPVLARLIPDYAALLAHTGLAPNDVAAAVVFTTQHATRVSEAIAADIRTHTYGWSEPPTCEVEAGMRRCSATFEAFNYRDPDGVNRSTTPTGPYTLPFVAWLPEAQDGPLPTMVFGHGIAHDLAAARAMAKVAVPLGFAVVATDSVAHGDHPDAPEDSSLDLLTFFAVELEPAVVFKPLILRDNFRQSAWDKLQLLELVTTNPDLDGDGSPDLDTDQLVYVGESFGGVMAFEFLALTDRFQLAALQLGGGRVASIVAEADRFQVFNYILLGEVETESNVQRFYPMVQSIIDAGDASTYARHIFTDRLSSDDVIPPHLLLQLVLDDNTIPTPCSRSLVRALDLPQVPPVLSPVGLVSTTAPAPVSGNLAEGSLTAGVFQYDRRRTDTDSPVEAATHDYTPSSVEATHQLRVFLETWLAGDAPTIVDPYAELETPSL